jgi:hypothetical protein
MCQATSSHVLIKNNKVLLYTAQSVFNLEFPAIPQLRQFRRCTQLQLMANLGDRKNARYPQLASGKLTIWPCQIGFGRLASIKQWTFSGSVYIPGCIYIYVYLQSYTKVHLTWSNNPNLSSPSFHMFFFQAFLKCSKVHMAFGLYLQRKTIINQ